jgi:hypothetical protein
MNKHRIVQIAPLTHSGAYQVQEYKLVQPSNRKMNERYRYSYHQFEGIYGKFGSPLPDDYWIITPEKWEWVPVKHYLHDNYDSFYEAHQYILNTFKSYKSKLIKEKELAEFKNAAHGPEIPAYHFDPQDYLDSSLTN